MVTMQASVIVQARGSLKPQPMTLMNTLLIRRQGMMIVQSSSLWKNDMKIQTVMIIQQAYKDQQTLAVEDFQQKNQKISICST